MKDIKELVVDNFAGGGGASTGIAMALGRSVDIAINHDPAAIAMHRANHPDTKHYCESVWEVDPVEACAGRKVGLAWFSPDCKHFSKAKGSKPVEKSIRGLAWVAVRWAKLVRPRVIMLENVEEFKTWGPLKDNKPCPERKGRTFNHFVHALRRYRYKVEWRELRACDYGAPTTRKRFFLIARCDHLPIRWPAPTHGDPNTLLTQAGCLYPWRTAAEIIDWSIPCPSIFDRKKPLVENTMKRIAKGLKKFVVDNPAPFIVQVPVDAAQHSDNIVTPHIMDNQFNNVGGAVDMPLSTLLTGNHKYVVAPNLIQYHGEQSAKEVRGQDVEKPLMVVDSSNRYGLVTAFISKYFSGGYTGAGVGVEDPVPTVTAIDHNAIVTTHMMHYYGTSVGSEVDKPVGTITASGQHIAKVDAFLAKYYGQSEGQPITEPVHKITAKDRFGLVTIKGQEYRIVDIGMRMLTPRELFRAQGFPDDYVIDRDDTGKPYPKTAQVARCGNAVPPAFAKSLVAANLPELCICTEQRAI